MQECARTSREIQAAEARRSSAIARGEPQAEVHEQAAHDPQQPAMRAGMPRDEPGRGTRAPAPQPPVATKVSPSTRNAATLASRARDGLRKARKNSASFGLSMYVTGPSRNAVPVETAPRRACAGIGVGTSGAGDDTDHAVAMIAKAHAPVQRVRAGVVAHHVQERRLPALQLAADELAHQAACETSALVLGPRTNAADLVQRSRMEALPGHRDELPVREDAEVLAQLEGARTEGPGRVSVASSSAWVTCPAPSGTASGASSLGRRRALPHHVVHKRVDLDVPPGRRRARPAAAVEVLAGGAIGRERGKVGALRVAKADDRREAFGVAAGIAGAGRVARMVPGERMPGDVVEQVEHVPPPAAPRKRRPANEEGRNAAVAAPASYANRRG